MKSSILNQRFLTVKKSIIIIYRIKKVLFKEFYFSDSISSRNKTGLCNSL